jgi:NADH:ubiquinone oxidoreductase subunit E
MMEGIKGESGALISVLHKAQQLFGYLPEEVQEHVAESMQIPTSEVYGVVTFYNLFSTEPMGQFPVNVCLGTACYVRGADRVLARLKSELGIELGEVTADGLFSLESCRCIGACSLAPVITIGDEVHGKVTEHDVPRLVAQARQMAAAAQNGAQVATVGAGSDVA